MRQQVAHACLVGALSVCVTGCDGFIDWLGIGSKERVEHAPLPLVRTNGGPVLTAPRVVPIFFQGDPLESRIEAFLTALPGSRYWWATTGEYGVGDVRVAPAFSGVAEPDAPWALSLSSSARPGLASETGDLCLTTAGVADLYAPLVGDFTAQRTWSNYAAWSNLDPCVPAAPRVYFNAAPDLYETVPLRLDARDVYQSSGVAVPLHESRTIDVRLFSSGERPDWYVTASDVLADNGGPPSLELRWDRSSGNDSQILRLTITRIAEGPLGGSPILVYSSNQSGDFAASTTWAGFVGN